MDFGFNNLDQLENRLSVISESIFALLQNSTNVDSPPPIVPVPPSNIPELANLPIQINQIQSDISSISDKTNNFETIMYTLVAGVLAVVVVAFISISRTGNIDIKKLRKFVKP